MRFIMLITLLVFASACEDRDLETPTLDAHAFEWAELADGSSFGRSSGAGSFDVAARCWPDGQSSASSYTCLAASRHSGTGTLSIGRKAVAQLPEYTLSFVRSDTGYSCHYIFDATEEINRSGEALVSNPVRRHSDRWSPSYIEKYMAENQVEGTPHFPCLEVLSAVRQGSLATLGTTTVTRQMAGL